MRDMRTHFIVGLAVLSICTAGMVAAGAKDLTLRAKVTTGGPHAGTHEEMQYWTGNRMITDSPETRIIVDLDAQTLTVIDKRARTYFTQTAAEMRQQSDAMQAELQKRMEQLPPQAREMMEKMHGGQAHGGAPLRVNATGKSEKIAGYQAAEYAIEGGPMNSTVWASEALQPPGGAKAGEALAKMMSASGPGARMGEALTQIKGIPLRMVMTSGMGPQAFTRTSEVVEVTEKAPPADVLTVPEGFKQAAPPSFDAVRGPRGAPRQ